MSPPQDALPPDLQRRIRAERKFSLGEAIGREGGSFLKDSQMPRPLRALTAINGLIDRYLSDRDGALQLCLKNWVKTDGRIGQYLDEPLVALQLIVTDIVEQPQILCEFARQVTVRWGKLNGERPHFQKLGEDAHPEAAYSHDSIRGVLTVLLERLSADS
ncbi:MAG: hypothetical protein AAF243_17525, partial [Cyanobacteria bacterium P01_A01_bin.137]